MEILNERNYVPLYRSNFIFRMSKLGKPTLNLLNSSHRMIDQVIQLKRKDIFQTAKTIAATG